MIYLIGICLMAPFLMHVLFDDTVITSALTQKPPWRLAQGRVELLDKFYHNLGFESSGINVRVVMQVPYVTT